jgi:hypothetical protein
MKETPAETKNKIGAVELRINVNLMVFLGIATVSTSIN